jgi:hypothetical protein
MDVDEDISHDSNAEKRIDVEMPPRMRPAIRIGNTGIWMHTQARAYVTQNARQALLRPL